MTRLMCSGSNEFNLEHHADVQTPEVAHMHSVFDRRIGDAMTVLTHTHPTKGRRG